MSNSSKYEVKGKKDMNTKKSRIIQKIIEEYTVGDEDREVLEFGFKLLKNSILGFGAILIVAYLGGIFIPVVTASITAAIFRTFTGGAHAKSPAKCIIFGVVIFNILGIITVQMNKMIVEFRLWGVFITVLIIAIISFHFYAPADTPGKPISTKVHKDRLRFFSFSFLLLWGVFIGVYIKGAAMHQYLVLASCLGLLWQSISLWPITYSLFGHRQNG